MRRAVAVRYSVAPAPTGSSTTGIPRAFAAPPASSIASTQCSESVPMFSTSADARPRHLLDLLARVRHHRQRAERERRIRRLVHDDVVRDLVDERLALAQSHAASNRRDHRAPHPQHVDGTFSSTELDETLRNGARRRRGGAPRGIVEALAAREQRGERRRVRAAGAVRRSDVVPLDGDLDVALAVVEMVDGVVAVAAGDDHRRRAELVQALGELARASRRRRRAPSPP